MERIAGALIGLAAFLRAYPEFLINALLLTAVVVPSALFVLWLLADVLETFSIPSLDVRTDPGSICDVCRPVPLD